MAVGRIQPLRPKLERDAAGSGRRPLRVGRLPADHRAAARGESGARLRRYRQHYLFNDYPFPEAMHYEWADPYRASRITKCSAPVG